MAACAVGAFFVVSFIVMELWNAILPAAAGWHAIVWQAIGLFILTKILFGFPFRGHGGNSHWRRRMLERCASMTPEEREKFREGMRARCGEFGTPAADSKA
jgi:hypothetical protein